VKTRRNPQQKEKKKGGKWVKRGRDRFKTIGKSINNMRKKENKHHQV